VGSMEPLGISACSISRVTADNYRWRLSLRTRTRTRTRTHAPAARMGPRAGSTAAGGMTPSRTSRMVLDASFTVACVAAICVSWNYWRVMELMHHRRKRTRDDNHVIITTTPRCATGEGGDSAAPRQSEWPPHSGHAIALLHSPCSV
jgi:hypothetical protein